MNNTPVQAAQVAAIAKALRVAGFVEAAPRSGAKAVAMTCASSHVAVLVRIVPQHTARHAFITLICATCRRHRSCAWRALLGADVPPQVIAACAQTATSAPLPCDTAPPGP